MINYKKSVHKNLFPQFDSLKDPFLNPLKDTENGPTSVSSIVNLINLTKISDKMNTYTSFYELFVDVHWIIHNCLILFRSNVLNVTDKVLEFIKNNISERHDMVKTARALKKYFKTEIECVKKCAECYSNANTNPNGWIKMVCAKPHIVLWAKVNGWSYWPAKYMTFDGVMVNVRFFGDRTEANVPTANCLLYSNIHPTKLSKMTRTKNYNWAVKVSVFVK